MTVENYKKQVYNKVHEKRGGGFDEQRTVGTDESMDFFGA